MKSVILSSTSVKTLNPTAITGMPLLCRLARVSCCWKLIAQWIICQSYTMLQSAFITLDFSVFFPLLPIFLPDSPPLGVHPCPSILVVVFMLWCWVNEPKPTLVAAVDCSAYRKHRKVQHRWELNSSRTTIMKTKCAALPTYECFTEAEKH